jgi:hypothetical protein
VNELPSEARRSLTASPHRAAASSLSISTTTSPFRLRVLPSPRPPFPPPQASGDALSPSPPPVENVTNLSFRPSIRHPSTSDSSSSRRPSPPPGGRHASSQPEIVTSAAAPLTRADSVRTSVPCWGSAMYERTGGACLLGSIEAKRRVE